MRQCLEQGNKILVRIDVVRLAGLDDGIKIGAGIGAGHGIAEQKVAPADDEGPDRVLAEAMPAPRLCRVVHARDGEHGLS